MGRAAEMKPDQLSEFLPTPNGGVIVHLDERQPIDQAQFAQMKPQIEQFLARQNDEAVFADWLRLRKKEANLQIAHQ